MEDNERTIWLVEEVDEYTILTSSGLTPTTVTSDSPRDIYEISDIIAYTGTLLSGAATMLLCGPMCGALFGVFYSVVTTYAQGDESVYNSLAEDILEIAEQMILYADASDDATSAAEVLNSKRNAFKGTYKDDKEKYMSENNIDQLIAEANSLINANGLAYTYYDEIARYFGSDTDNLYRAFLGFDVLTLATVEVLSIFQEGILMLAYVEPERDCSDLYNSHELDDKVEELRTRLEETFDLIK